MKHVILVAYLALVIMSLAYVFQPDPAVIFITGLICGLEVIAKTLLTLDHSDKGQVLWFKIIFLTFLNVLAGGFLILGMSVSVEILGADTPGIKMLFYGVPFSIFGLDAYILYSYFAEPKKLTLI